MYPFFRPINMSIFNFNLRKVQCQWLKLTSHGFLLVELCGTLVVLLVLSFILSLWYLHITQEQAYLVRRSNALIYACSLLEKVRAFGSIPQENHSIYKISWDNVPDRFLKNYMHVTVKVMWQEQAKKHTVSLTTGYSAL
jgi:hypothetical protein